jgi:hypothetical protein
MALTPGQAPSGVAGTPNPAVTTVQGISGGTPAPVTDAAAEASLATIATATASAATSALQTSGNTSLTATAAALGTTADTAWASGSGSTIALLKGIFGKFAGVVLAAGSAVIGAVTQSGTWTVGLSAGTQAVGTVGVTSLPALVAGSAAIGTVSLTGSLPAGTNAIGSLTAGTAQIGLVTAGGYTTQVQVVPTVQAAAYAAGNVIGGLLTFASAARIAAGSGLVQSASCTFVSGVVPSLDLVLFNASPSGSTVTDKTAVAVATADLAKVIGVVHLTDTTLLGATTPSVVQGETQALPFKLTSGSTVYGALITRTAITLTSTSDATITLSVLQD